MTHPWLPDLGEKKKGKKKEKTTLKKKIPKPFSNQMFECICFWHAHGQAARPALQSLPAASRSSTRILSNPHRLFDVAEPGKNRGRYR